jgi:hypothetical protein
VKLKKLSFPLPRVIARSHRWSRQEPRIIVAGLALRSRPQLDLFPRDEDMLMATSLSAVPSEEVGLRLARRTG